MNIRELVIHYHQQGKNKSEIARMARYSVICIIQRFTTTGLTTANPIGTCGRRRALTIRTTRLLGRTSVSEPLLTARELQKSVGGLISYRPKAAPSLGRVQKQTRLMFCLLYTSPSPRD